jgi:hypothetical protein
MPAQGIDPGDVRGSREDTAREIGKIVGAITKISELRIELAGVGSKHRFGVLTFQI